MENIIICGGAGFIGSTFVGQMIEKNYNIIVLDALTYAGSRANLENVAPNGGWELVQGSICNGKLISELLAKYQPKYLVNFAAESHVDNSISSPDEFIKTNIIGCYTLLETIRAYQKCRFLHISTDEVYGSLTTNEARFTEQNPMRPNSPYSASKAASDHLCRAWSETYELDIIVTNCSNNYGARQYPEKLIPFMIKSALNGDALTIYGDGKNIRDWIHAEDHCEGIYLALTRGISGETYCFGGDAERTNLQVVNIICEYLNEIKPKNNGSYKDQIKFITDRAGHDRRYAIDDGKAISKLGFTRKYNFTDGIKQTINWYLQNNDWLKNTNKEKI